MKGTYVKSQENSTDIMLMLDQVVDYWRVASAKAGVPFDDFRPARVRSRPLHPEMKSEVWVDLDSEVSFGVGIAADGNYSLLFRSRAEVDAVLQASDAIFAVKDFAMMLGKQFRRATGQTPLPQGWNRLSPEIVPVAVENGDVTYYLGESRPGARFITTAWEGVERSWALCIPIVEFLHALQGSPRVQRHGAD